MNLSDHQQFGHGTPHPPSAFSTTVESGALLYGRRLEEYSFSLVKPLDQSKCSASPGTPGLLHPSCVPPGGCDLRHESVTGSRVVCGLSSHSTSMSENVYVRGLRLRQFVSQQVSVPHPLEPIICTSQQKRDADRHFNSQSLRLVEQLEITI